MARFIFRLEALLRQRRLIEEQRQTEMAAAQREVTRIETELRRINESRESVAAQMRSNHLVGRLNLSLIAAHRRFGTSLARQIAALNAERVQHQATLDAARLALVEAARERKTVEKLKEQQFARWQEDQARRELADSDEVGMQLSADNLRDDL